MKVSNSFALHIQSIVYWKYPFRRLIISSNNQFSQEIKMGKVSVLYEIGASVVLNITSARALPQLLLKLLSQPLFQIYCDI
jgi:hypothetical protein